MKKCFTLHTVMNQGRFGFDSTHYYREKMMVEFGVEHRVVYTDIPNNKYANWCESLLDKGITSFTHVILDLSNISRHKPCLTEKEIFPQGTPEDVSQLILTKDGFVGQIIYADNKREYYTSSLFLEVEENKFRIYNKIEMLLEGYVSGSGEYITSSGKSQVDYLLEYLVEESNQDDIFIIDLDKSIFLPKLKRFFLHTKRKLYSMVHYNILAPFTNYQPVTWAKRIIASEPLADLLKDRGEDVLFLPPAISENEAKEKHYNTVTDWCLVGDASSGKRVFLALQAFGKLLEYTSDIKLSIYGKLPQGISENQLPKNIIFKGEVARVPYENYQGYLSTSASELFANAMVEASSNNLVCLVSDVLFAHHYYASIDKNVITFNKLQDLIEKLLISYKYGAYSATFSNTYTKENVKKIYTQVFNLKC